MSWPVSQVACIGVAEKREDLLGVLYDGFVRYACALVRYQSCVCGACCCRQHWEELSPKKHSFNVDEHVGDINDTALRRARSLHDSFFGAPSSESAKLARQPFQDVRFSRVGLACLGIFCGCA